MFLDLKGLPCARPTIFNSLVTPRPIAWVSTVDAAGVPNLAPFSYFNLLTSSPPTVIFSCVNPRDRDEKDTLANVRATGEFVVNLVSHPLLQAMHATSAAVPRGCNEFELAGVASAGSIHVRAPRVQSAPAAMECRLLQLLDIQPEHEGDQGSTAVLGRIIGLHVADEFLDAAGRFDSVRARLMSRLGGPFYAEIGTVMDLTQAGMD
jgi:flavin reductase (DIM6/NTAB) family NADH-FMN oxidoreductase RutF